MRPAASLEQVAKKCLVISSYTLNSLSVNPSSPRFKAFRGWIGGWAWSLWVPFLGKAN